MYGSIHGASELWQLARAVIEAAQSSSARNRAHKCQERHWRNSQRETSSSPPTTCKAPQCRASRSSPMLSFVCRPCFVVRFMRRRNLVSRSGAFDQPFSEPPFEPTELALRHSGQLNLLTPHERPLPATREPYPPPPASVQERVVRRKERRRSFAPSLRTSEY